MKDEHKAAFRAYRKSLDGYVTKIAGSPKDVNDNLHIIPLWKPGPQEVGSVVRFGGDPYKVIQAHDSTATPDWTPPAVPALFAPYHGTSPETARPFVQPTHAGDIYRAGEYMIWRDSSVMQCVMNTSYGPDVAPEAWE